MVAGIFVAGSSKRYRAEWPEWDASGDLKVSDLRVR